MGYGLVHHTHHITWPDMLRSLTALSYGVRRLAITTAATATAPSRVISAPASGSASAIHRSLHSTTLRLDIATGAADVETTEELIEGAKKGRKAGAKKSTTAGTTTTGTKKAAPKTKAKTKKAAAAPKKPKKKAIAKPKAPPKPKRVLHPPKPINSAWVLYFKQKLADLPKEEKKNVTELSTRYAADFRALSGSERAKIDAELEEYKTKYEAELAAWKETVPPEMIEQENEFRRMQRKTSKKKANPRLMRDPTKPARPLNGYVRWSNEVRSDPEKRREIIGIRELTDIPAVEQVKKMAEVWREMGEEQKRPYVEAFNAEKQQYDAAMEEWKSANAAKA